MIYTYQCRECGYVDSDAAYHPIGGLLSRPCPLCGGQFRRRVAQFTIARSMPEHFNHSVGKPVSSMRQFKDELKRGSDAMSERTGMDHNYVPVDLDDTSALGVTEEGLDSTRKVRRDAGMDEPAKRVIT